MPLFYAIGSLDDNNKLSLKLITFHGKIVDQINEADHPLMTNDDKLNFVGKLEKLKLCMGIEMPDTDLKLDARTFSSMYLVERLQQDVIIRSYHCQYALYDNPVCKMCTALSSAYGHEEKLEAIDGFDFDEGDNISLDYDYSAEIKPSLDINGDIKSLENYDNLYSMNIRPTSNKRREQAPLTKKKRKKLSTKCPEGGTETDNSYNKQIRSS